MSDSSNRQVEAAQKVVELQPDVNQTERLNRVLRPLLEAALVATEGRDSPDSLRLFHGRGHCHPGLHFLTIDLFAPAIVVTLFEPQLPAWERALTQLLTQCAPAIQCIYIQRRDQASKPFDCVYGEPLAELYARRGGLRYCLSTNQQNIGFFLDIEPARAWLESCCENKKVLNLFAYTCTFSVVAMAAGAASVVNMDLSSKSLNTGRQNHRINALDVSKVAFYANDILKSWSRLNRAGPYDIVIIDPPSFQKGSFIATKDYAKVLRRMNRLTALGGYALVCLNSPELPVASLQAEAEAHLDGFEYVQRLPTHSDFPDIDEQRSLKLLVYKKVAQAEGLS